jgi:hypothetical protein
LDDAGVFLRGNRHAASRVGAKSSEIPGDFNTRAKKSLNFPGDSARALAPHLDVPKENALAREQFRAATRASSA